MKEFREVVTVKQVVWDLFEGILHPYTRFNAGILAGTYKTPIVIPFDESLIPSEAQLKELSAIEDIVMVGYPDGIWDSFNNLS